MSNYSLWEHLKPEDRVKLIQHEWNHYGVKLDIMIMPVPPVTLIPSWPTLEECEKSMKQKPYKMKRVA